jgi:hypothetical protein
MNIPSETSRSAAVSNALSSIRKDRCLPEKVLVGHWEDYLFFEPFMMFAPGFIDVTSLLLTEEKASVIALINLGNVIPIDYNNPLVIFIEENTGAKEYISELECKGTPLSWRVSVDRYVCASDKGYWSIYCEKENDVGVFAFRKDFPQSICLQIEKLLKAKSIRFSSSAGDTQCFDFGKLLPDWRATLVAEHSLTNSRGLRHLANNGRAFGTTD